MVRQHETKRPDDMRRDLPEDFALDQRLADQPELVIFEIAQAAMHELGRPGRRSARQVIHFTKENGISAPGGIARDAAAIDAAPNDREVENPIQRRFPGVRLFTLAISLSVWIKSQLKTKATEKGNLSPVLWCHLSRWRVKDAAGCARGCGLPKETSRVGDIRKHNEMIPDGVGRYENFPHARSVAHQISPLAPRMTAPNPTHPSRLTVTGPAPSAVTGTIMAR